MFVEANVPDGDPANVATAVLKLVDSQAPPLRLLLSDISIDTARSVTERRLAEWDHWEPITRAAT